MDPLDPEAEALFENAPFGSTRRYIDALSKRRASLKHQLIVIRTNTNPRKADKTSFIEKQIRDLDEELKGYDHRNTRDRGIF